MTVAINNESGVSIDEHAIVALAQFVLDEMAMHPLAELSVMLVDEQTMSTLHKHFMDEDGPTDVLAFPMDELRPLPGDEQPELGLLGDVVLCPDVAERQAVAAAHTMRSELELLCTHGILHLLGYDHSDADEQREMFGLQSKLLAEWQATAPQGQA